MRFSGWLLVLFVAVSAFFWLAFSCDGDDDDDDDGDGGENDELEEVCERILECDLEEWLDMDSMESCHGFLMWQGEEMVECMLAAGDCDELEECLYTSDDDTWYDDDTWWDDDTWYDDDTWWDDDTGALTCEEAYRFMYEDCGAYFDDGYEVIDMEDCIAWCEAGENFYGDDAYDCINDNYGDCDAMIDCLIDLLG